MMLRDAIDHMNWLAEHSENEKTFRYTTSYSYFAPYWDWDYQYWSINRFYWYGFKTWLKSGLWSWKNFKKLNVIYSFPPFSKCYLDGRMDFSNLSNNVWFWISWDHEKTPRYVKGGLKEFDWLLFVWIVFHFKFIYGHYGHYEINLTNNLTYLT